MQKLFGTKNGPSGRSPGPGNPAKNAKTPFHCDVDNGKPQTQPKKFFFNLRYKTCWIHRGFNTSLAAGKVWLCKLFKYFQEKLGPLDWDG